MADRADYADELEIVPIDRVPVSDIVAAITDGLGQGHDEDWFRWKHIENPHGRSLGWVARDAAGVVGVRLFMRWTLQCGARLLTAVRPVDTVTVQRARKKGVFRHLTTLAVEHVKGDPEVGLVFNTPNQRSQPGYRRMGWTLLPRIALGLRLLMPGATAELDSDEGVFGAFDEAPPEANRLATRRNRKVLEWRYGERSPVRYGRARLRQGQACNGMIYRIVDRRGVRLLLVHELIGSPAERRLLAKSAARREKARAIMLAIGPGALPLLGGPSIRRGGVTLAVRPLRPCEPDPTCRDNWALTLGDLERTM